jgi:pyruvate/2-oxoacid:ferredoxin oxidoreductase beta subunit
MRRPPNTQNATTTCKGCGATIARSLAGEPCPKVLEIVIRFDPTKLIAAINAVSESTTRTTAAITAAFGRSFHDVVAERFNANGSLREDIEVDAS